MQSTKVNHLTSTRMWKNGPSWRLFERRWRVVDRPVLAKTRSTSSFNDTGSLSADLRLRRDLEIGNREQQSALEAIQRIGNRVDAIELRLGRVRSDLKLVQMGFRQVNTQLNQVGNKADAVRCGLATHRNAIAVRHNRSCQGSQFYL